ncbi:hypothetical protein Peur_003831 [Populus x canadensis]
MIKGMLEWLNVKARNEGHVPDCSSVLLDVDDVDKEQWLWVHSERLALAYGLIRTPSICHVHIIKNLLVHQPYVSSAAKASVFTKDGFLPLENEVREVWRYFHIPTYSFVVDFGLGIISQENYLF